MRLPASIYLGGGGFMVKPNHTALASPSAVPAVLCYNLLVRRNKVLNEKFRSFSNDLQTYLLSSKR